MLAARMSKFSGSPTSALIAKIAELRAQGQKIISLNIGEPDFGTPDYIKVAGIKAIVENFTKYTPTNGILDLRKAIQKKLKEDNGINYELNEICTTVGAKQAIFNSVMCVAGDGDEVLLPIPCWVSYTEMVKIAGATPVFVPVQYDNGYALDLAKIEAAVTPRTRAIIICSPNNPTGAVYSEESLRKLAELALKYHFYIICDEIYEKLIYDGEKHFSVASISKEVRDITLTVNGVSKAYAMTGWRLGYVAANKEVIDGVKNLQSQVTSATSAISQKAAVAALTGPQYDLADMVKEFDKRRKFVTERFNAIPGVHCLTPKGAFYLLPDVAAYFGKSNGKYVINNAKDLAQYVLETEQVAFVPGEAFNIEGKIRISYSNSLENLDEAIKRIEHALSLLK